MQQNKITTLTPLLENGRLKVAGYATRMNFVYNRHLAKGPVKEWDFYQIICGTTVVQFTVGHITRFAQISANIIDLQTGEKRSVGKTLLFARQMKKQMGANPEKPSMFQYFGKKLKMQIEVTPTERRLTLSEKGKMGIRSQIDITLTNCSAHKDKMVIATPFFKPKQWYLNYKENCYVANGYCRIDDVDVEIRNGNGLLDWGRGVWPRKHSWVWGNGSTTVNGKHFGFNIGGGFGDTSHATENMFFLDNKAYKLGEICETQIGDNFRYTDKEKKFCFNVTPIFDNYTRTNAPTVHNSCHQVFGKWSGFVTLPDGKTVEIPPFVAFCEHAENNW